MTNSKPALPAYHYPSLAVLIDDNERFLSSLSFHLDSRLAYKRFSDPKLALKYIEEHHQPSLLPQKCLNTDFDSDMLELSEHAVKLNFSPLQEQIYNSQRFSEPTVAVVDYSMPSMNGPEVCQRLKKINKFIKIILLTGEADESKGIEMFNNGLIDKFILKNNSHFGELVNANILDLQKKYFDEQSEILIQNLSTKSILCLTDEKFIAIFNDLCRRDSVVEYYLIKNTGSFLLLTIDATPIWIIVTDDSELKHYSEISEDSGMSDALHNDLKEGKKIPFFKNQEDYMSVGSEWETHLHPAKKITHNNQNYYYAVIKDKNLADIKTSTILSYKDYLKTWSPS